MRFLCAIVLLSIAAFTGGTASAIDPSQAHLPLERDILIARLAGDYDRALALTEHLKTLPNGLHLGTALDLDTRLTRLSWDSQNTEEDPYLFGLSEQLISLCPKKLKGGSAEILFQCGRGHFGRSYLSALRGSLYDAGSHGSQAIKAFEAALDQDPERTEVKLPLGMAYFYADHLPPFAKLMAPFLWFIPTGNSDKSLPYIEAVMNGGGPYADAARFIYSDLVMQKAPAQMRRASAELKRLIDRYPSNPRLHLAHLSSYAYQRDWPTAYASVKALQGATEQHSKFAAVGNIWEIYLLRYLKQPLPAELQAGIIALTPSAIPEWAEDWLRLAQGLAYDFSGDRDTARTLYQQVLSSGNNFGSGWLLELAAEGLEVNLYPGAD